MNNNLAPQGYEQIGNWYVNLSIPQNVRDLFKKNINSQLKGSIPDDNDTVFYANLTKNCLEFRLLDEIKQTITEESSGEFEELLKKYNTGKNPESIVQLAGLWLIGAMKKSESGISYVEHQLAGSTSGLPPDPFVDATSYFKDRLVDRYDNTKDSGIIRISDNLYTCSPLSLFIEQAASGKNRSDAGITYPVIITIDCKTREARIDPAN